MKSKLKLLIICIAIPLGIGALSALLTMNAMSSFGALNQPPLSPPSWLFPIVWTVLYTLMGIASYLILTSGEPRQSISHSLSIYALQLAFNFFWPLIFFNMQQYFLAFIWIVLLWVLVVVNLVMFWRISKPAGYLLIPYLLWITFAAYLNYSIYLLN